MANQFPDSAFLKNCLLELRNSKPLDPLTTSAAYSRCVSFLRQDVGDGEARAMARAVIDSLARIDHAHLMKPDMVLSDADRINFEVALQLLIDGSPLPYAMGHIEFCGLTFLCDERALIPRPETELLVDIALVRLQNIAAPSFADLGTGTGCIAIACLHAREDITAVVTDLSPGARALARKNAEALGVSARLKIVAGRENEWARPIEPFGPFDAILSNPPYIPAGEIETLDRNVQREPRLALDGGEDGLDPYRALAAQCSAVLKPNGFLACELGAGQFADVRDIFETQGWRVERAIKDFAGHERVLVAVR